MEQKIILSVIIVTYCSDDYIFDAIRSVNQYNDLPAGALEIIIVDNSPAAYSQNSFSRLRETFNQENLILIHNSKNGGYGQGNNLGIARAAGSYICIMNPDVLLNQPIYQNMIRKFSDPLVAMAGGKQIGYKDISFYIKPEYEYFVLTTFISAICNTRNIYNSRYMYLSGALLFVDKAKFNEIGGFDENIFLYCEEPDLTNRFLQKKYRCVYDGSLPYRHLIDDRTEVSSKSTQTLIEATRYYLEKFGFSFRRFLLQKIISYRVIYFVYTLMGNKYAAEKSQKQISLYRKYLS